MEPGKTYRESKLIHSQQNALLSEVKSVHDAHEQLKLPGQGLKPEEIQKIVQRSKKFSLSGQNLKSKQFQEILKDPGVIDVLSKVSEIDLSGNMLGSIPREFWDIIGKNPNRVSINFGGNILTDLGTESLPKNVMDCNCSRNYLSSPIGLHGNMHFNGLGNPWGSSAREEFERVAKSYPTTTIEYLPFNEKTISASRHLAAVNNLKKIKSIQPLIPVINTNSILAEFVNQMYISCQYHDGFTWQCNPFATNILIKLEELFAKTGKLDNALQNEVLLIIGKATSIEEAVSKVYIRLCLDNKKDYVFGQELDLHSVLYWAAVYKLIREQQEMSGGLGQDGKYASTVYGRVPGLLKQQYLGAIKYTTDEREFIRVYLERAERYLDGIRHKNAWHKDSELDKIVAEYAELYNIPTFLEFVLDITMEQLISDAEVQLARLGCHHVMEWNDGYDKAREELKHEILENPSQCVKICRDFRERMIPEIVSHVKEWIEGTKEGNSPVSPGRHEIHNLLYASKERQYRFLRSIEESKSQQKQPRLHSFVDTIKEEEFDQQMNLGGQSPSSPYGDEMSSPSMLPQYKRPEIPVDEKSPSSPSTYPYPRGLIIPGRSEARQTSATFRNKSGAPGRKSQVDDGKATVRRVTASSFALPSIETGSSTVNPEEETKKSENIKVRPGLTAERAQKPKFNPAQWPQSIQDAHTARLNKGGYILSTPPYPSQPTGEIVRERVMGLSTGSSKSEESSRVGKTQPKANELPGGAIIRETVWSRKEDEKLRRGGTGQGQSKNMQHDK